MKRLVAAAIGLSIAMHGLVGSVSAQYEDSISTDASGASVTSTAGLNPTASGEGTTIVYGDINTGGAGRTVITPPIVVQNGSTSPAAAPAPEPEPVAASVEEPVAAEPVEAAATSDLDGDNYPDELEPALGLDPAAIDTDADGVADGDELNIYATDPTIYDSDGDGVSDGAELYDTRTDPLVWDDLSAPQEEAVEESAQTAAGGDKLLAQQTVENLTAADGNAAALGTGNASASPGTVTREGGTSLLGPDGRYSVSETTPPLISVGDDGFAPEPAAVAEVVAEPAPEAIADPVAEETAIAPDAAAVTDADGDNYPDAAELDLGLDPANIDTDGDGAADGDELNIYGTEPTLFDTDGDGVGDGGELFDTRTDPLVWDDFSVTTESTEAVIQ